MKRFLFLLSILFFVSCSSSKDSEEIISSETISIPPVPSTITVQFPKLICPLKGEILKKGEPIPNDRESILITSNFGEREVIFKGMGGEDGDLHKGDDMVPMLNARTVNKQARILAVAEGTVYIHYPPPGRKFHGHPIYGALIILDHGNGIYSLYGHMKETWVRQGQRIKQGEPMGVIGSTGISTGVHLHWEMCYNPLILLKASE
jgi:murein DD-endopeptidase MepM/ murein hydrolase activator NlpD